MSDAETLLVLGADGFLGTHVRAAAESAGLRVIGTSRRAGEGEVYCDLTEPDTVAEAVRSTSPHLVLNLAGLASVAASWEAPAETFTVNATGVLNLLEAVAEHAPAAHVTCTSSAEIYGAPTERELPLREDHQVAPVNPYGASKAAMEVVCAQHARARGTSVAIIRSFNQIGPGQSPRFVASDFARQVAAAELRGGNTAELEVGDLTVERDFIDARDSSRAYVAAAQARLTGAFNLCSGKAVRLSVLVEEIERSSSLKVIVRSRQERTRPAEAPVLVGSAERLREAIGWAPQIPLAQTVADLLDWWRLREQGSGDKPLHGIAP